MFIFRDRDTRGRASTGWLDSRHSFSFGHYYDPAHMGFRALRVINEDRVAPGAGFAPHGHSDMEIISYVLSGELAHRDSVGTGSVIRPGEIQRMSAGTGIQHSEMNASSEEPVHFYQIWILPERRGIAPGYEQLAMAPVAEGETRLDRIGGRSGGEGAITIHQDVVLWRASIADGGLLELPLDKGRHAWIQATQGVASLADGGELRAGDGVAVTGAERLRLSSQVGAELLIFDLA
jgi:redox-sensitive bicupin YhaK (pirin superfamily)